MPDLHSIMSTSPLTRLIASLSAKSNQDARLNQETPGLSLKQQDSFRRTPQEFLAEVRNEILGPFSQEKLLAKSRAFKAQFRHELQSNPACMLPSFNYELSTGSEKGRFLALDLGGSTLRVGIIELSGKLQDNEGSKAQIVKMQAFRIGKEVRDLVGTSFFDWMAFRVIETLKGYNEGLDCPAEGASLPMALTWSFPVEQTSLRSGRLQAMGKRFRAAEGLVNEDLSTLVESACLRAGLVAKVHVLLNDTTATLISQTYTHPSTRMALVLGTGVNMAAYLPLYLVGDDKVGQRSEKWHQEARMFIVNAELSMFGGQILRRTRWDTMLSNSLPRPDFQPLEHMVSGMYLGEIVRLILLEAIEKAGVLGGIIPKAFEAPYSLGSEILSMAEVNLFTDFETAIESDSPTGSSPPRVTAADRLFLRSLSAIVSRRSAAITSAAVHAMWELRHDSLQERTTSSPLVKSSASPLLQAEACMFETAVAYTGSVVEGYPGYVEMCQSLVDQLVNESQRDEGAESFEAAKLVFIHAQESSLLGAGIALAAAIGSER